MKMKSSSILLLFTVYCFLFSSGYAGDTTGALPYLRMGVGARAMGMGGAFTAVSDDASSIYWNPAGLPNLENKEILAMYSSMSLDRSLNWLNFVMPLRFGSIGLGIINSGVANINGYDENQNFLGKFSYQSTGILLSYGRKIEEIVNAGVNLKIITDSLKDYSRSGYGLDFGALISPAEKLKLGLKLQDIAGSIGSDTIPMSISMGASYRLLGDKLLLSADMNKITDIDTLKIRMGLEYSAADILSIHAGLNEMNFSFGTTLYYKIFKLSYAYVVDPLKAGDRNLISFGAKF
ncbi:MAG: PorV/PorQ family protein [Elusimicrobiota bacterium]